MVRRDLEAEGGFGGFFAQPDGDAADAVRGSRRLVAEVAVAGAAALAPERGLTDAMGQLNHERGGRLGGTAAGPFPPRTPARGGRDSIPPGSHLAPQAGVGEPEPGDPSRGSAPTTTPGRGWGEPAAEMVADPGLGGSSVGRRWRPRETGRHAGSSRPGDPRRPAEPPRPERWIVGDAADRWLRDQVGTFAPGAVPPAPFAPGAVPQVGTFAPGTVPPAPDAGRGNGTWEGAPGSVPAIRPGGRGDDEGGPGDSPASVAWLRAGRGTGYGTAPQDPRHGTEGWAPYREVQRRLDPESGVLLPGERRYDQPGSSSVARLEPEPPRDPQRHAGSVAGLSDWERWLELCARIDGFPRHLSIHSGGMLVTAAPLIDIAPIERATMKDRVVVQYDKRDVETMKLIKLDLLGLGMLAAIDETVQLIEHDCAVCLDLDRLPEEIGEVFEMLQAADTVGVFQVESRAQMQTLPKSRPASLDDLVVEVAIIRPGPIQGNAVHPYLRRKQGLEPVTYLHPSMEPILHDTLGVILYQEQVMRIAIDVAGFTPAGSDAFRRAMGTYRSAREMDKLHEEFVTGCVLKHDMPAEYAEELFRRCAAFASFGFAKSHAAAFARTAYESSFLKLFYPAQFTTGLINAQPMGFYPVEVLVNDAKRHGVAILPVDVNRSSYRTTTEWVGRPGWALAGVDGDDGSHDADRGEPLPDGSGIEAHPKPVRSSACVVPGAASRDRWAAESMTGWGIRLGLHLVKGIGEEQQQRLDAELERGPYASLADVVERTGLAEEVVERLIRAGALDSLGSPRRELLWQLREVAGASKGRVDGRTRGTKGITRAAGRPMDLRLPATEAPSLSALTESERLGDAYAVIGMDARRQAVGLFRGALDRLGAVTNGSLNERRSGRVRLGGLVVTRQHPMTAKGTVFLALEDETGMVNVTLWPDTWQRLRSVVRRNALLLVDGDLQRDGEVVNVIAREVVPLVEAAAGAGGPESPAGVRHMGQAGMRRLG
ncbi:MAG TPA: OB-fold nucleic acid binding domain-containing protein [Myxococcaceae bacterium]|nr:OB-fold nucleic acid binding domain-containing protein [Myxococcaceae bacterium]